MKNVFENEKVNKLLEELSAKLKASVITSVVKKPKEYSVEELLAVFEIMYATKSKDSKELPKYFEFEKVRPKISRSITKKLLTESFEVLQSIESLEYAEVIDKLKEQFMVLLDGKKPAAKEVKENEEVKPVEEKKVKEIVVTTKYQNPEASAILMEFEANESIVFLINLINRAYSKDLPMARVNRAIIASHIILAVKESGENNVISFAKLGLQQIRDTFKASLTQEILQILYSAICVLEQRVKAEKPEEKEAAMDITGIKKRFEALM